MIRSLLGRARTLGGVIRNDLWKYRHLFRKNTASYLAICNRSEHLQSAPNTAGYRCLWQWTSDLYAPKVIPVLGRWLMRRSLLDHPVVLAPRTSSPDATVPQISFIIGHRGLSRLPHLLATLRSIAAQRIASVECIVVAQEIDSKLGGYLPSWVRTIHTPPPSADMPYCRSWAFNIGAQHARGAVLVLHDSDMLVPVDYAEQILRRVTQEYEVVNLKRFIFYLTQAHTSAIFEGTAQLFDAAPEVIVQNGEGGGSVAITRAAYDEIGGLDESFVGWGGEDNEFWERAQSLRECPWADLPLVHLWHASQPGKQEADYHTAQRYRALARFAPQERTRRLRAAQKGRLEGPLGWPAAFCESDA